MKTKDLVAAMLQFSCMAATAMMSQQAYLKSSIVSAGDNFGWTVSIDGDTLVVGAPFESSGAVDSGAAYVFVRSGTNWIQQALLKEANPVASDQFGASVSVSVDTLVVGANRENSNATGVNGNPANQDSTDSGAAYVFVRNGTNWTQQAYLKASNTGTNDQFGWSVAVDGDTIVVGAKFEDSRFPGVQTDNSLTDSGAAYVFARNGTNWSQQAYLKPSNPGANYNFGWSVTVSSNTVVIGTPFESTIGVASGAAYVFVRNGTNWTQQAYLKAANADPGDQLGASVSVWGDTLVAGANREASSATGVNGGESDNSAPDSGAAYVFTRTGTNWTRQAYLKASNTGPGDQFGWRVGISVDTIVVSARGEDSQATGVNGIQDDEGFPASGAAYVFVRSGTNWSQQAYLKASNRGDGDQFGFAAAVSGESVVIGAPLEASAGDPNDDSAFQAGAAYVFTGFVPPPPLSILQSNDQVHVSWPVSAAGFTLEETSALEPASSWTEVPPPHETNATQISVSVSRPSGQRFYRLRQ